MSIAEQLAAHTVAFKDPESAAVAASKTAFIDTIGVTLLGASDSSTRILLQTPGVAEAAGPSLLFGTNRRTSSLDATLVNGHAAHALDFDDFNQAFGGHPSVPLVPALLALGEAQGASGQALITAYIVGVEVESRIANGVHFHHYEKGWHPTSTLGTLGACAAACHLLKLSREMTAIALAIGTSLASGIKANFGTMTKPLHVGHSARNGVLAALLAERGFTANVEAFEHTQGFLNVFNGEGTFDVERIVAPWESPLAVVEPGASIKQFPCCGSIHAPAMMMLTLVSEHRLQPVHVEHIEVLIHPRRLPHTNNPNPQSALEAKFSIQYCVARALASGELKLCHFEGDAHNDPVVRSLMAKTTVRAHPEMTNPQTAFGAEVIVARAGRTTVSARVEQMVGRGRHHPMSDDELRSKFSDCSTRTVSQAQSDRLWTALNQLDTIADIRELTHFIELPDLAKERA